MSMKPSLDEKNSKHSENCLPNCEVKIETSPRSDRELKRLSKKYASLSGKIEELEREVCQNPTMGTPIGHSCYKIRLAIKSKGKGKSGGARVITYYYIHGETVYLLSIYDKAEQENISEERIAELLLGVKEP